MKNPSALVPRRALPYPQRQYLHPRHGQGISQIGFEPNKKSHVWSWKNPSPARMQPKDSKSIIYIYRHQMNSEYVWIDDCIPPCYNQSNFLKKTSHIISSSTQLPSPKDSGGSSPRNFGAAEWLPRGHGETQHRFHSIGAERVVGKEFFSKNQTGAGGKNWRYNTNYRIFWKQFDVLFFWTNAWTAQFVVDVHLFFVCFLVAFVVAQVFPRYDHLTLPPAPGHIPPFIYSAGSNGNKSDDAPPLPVPPPPPAPVSAEADSAAVRFGLEGDSRKGRIGALPSQKLTRPLKIGHPNSSSN